MSIKVFSQLSNCHPFEQDQTCPSQSLWKNGLEIQSLLLPFLLESGPPCNQCHGI